MGGDANHFDKPLLLLFISNHRPTVEPSLPYLQTRQFTKKSCESLGINYELRRVGAARQDQGDQPGVEIGVEEAILEANEEDGVDGIMVRTRWPGLRWYDGLVRLMEGGPCGVCGGYRFITRFMEDREISICSNVFRR